MSVALDRLRRRLPAVLGLAAAAAGAAALYSFTAAGRYEATGEVLVSPVAADDPTFAGLGLLAGDPGSAVSTSARLVRTPEVADAVRDQLGLRESRDRVLRSVDVRRVDDTRLVAGVGALLVAGAAAALVPLPAESRPQAAPAQASAAAPAAPELVAEPEPEP